MTVMVGVRVTAGVVRVCALLLTDPDCRWYGLEIGRRLNMGSGVVYPLLLRLENAGVLAGEAEPPLPDRQVRPARRWLWLTPEGKVWAEQIVAKMSADLARSG
jgi:PadR family transcriptional regulator PadR